MSLSIFANKLDVDDREPILTISLYGKEWGLFPPLIGFWIQLLAYIVPCAMFSMLVATITYKLIIARRPSFISYFVGFGIVIPLCICYFPFWILNLLDVRNKLMRFCISAIYPVLTMFRTSEAMFGFSPHTVESSYKNYILYYCAGVEIQFDPLKKRPISSSRNEKIESIKTFIMYLFILGMYKSIFGPSQYQPLPTNVNGNNQDYNWKDIFDVYSLCNNFVSTMLLQLYLSTFLAALNILVIVLFGIKVKEGMMRNPLMKASSPSDFWSGRWNVLVHGVLKRGVFKPVCRYSSKFVAVLATFLVSGLFHEYILIACNAPHLGFQPALGKNTAFMMVNAGIIIIEALIGNAKIFSWIKKVLPSFIVTILVICTAMPIAHWFLHPYIKSGMNEHGELCVPMIKLIR